VAERRKKTTGQAPPPARTGPTESSAGLDARPLVERAINRAISEQYAQAAQEVERIIDATYRVVEREGSVEPKIRDILQEAGLATQAFYRHFTSKDELLLVILDDGRRRLAQYLAHRMEKAPDPVAQVRAWIEGMLAQAADPAAASRTRPFMVSLQRLGDLYPDEQQASIALLVDMLSGAVRAGIEAELLLDLDPERSAYFVYSLSIAVMEDHVLHRTVPTAAEIDELVSFALRALGADLA